MTFFNLELQLELAILTLSAILAFCVISGCIFVCVKCRGKWPTKRDDTDPAPRQSSTRQGSTRQRDSPRQSATRIQEVSVIEIESRKTSSRSSQGTSTNDSCYVHCPSPTYESDGEDNRAFQFDEHFVNVIVTF